VTVSGVCLLSASSVTQRICNVRGSTQWASRVRPVRATPYYNDCGHEVVAGEKYTPSRLRIVVTFGRTTQYGTRTWIVTLPPVSFQTPPDGRHTAREIIVSVKLLYSRKTVWCWLPHGCEDQRGSFVELRLLSNQRRNRHICGWVKMKRYRRQAADQWRRYTTTRQMIWPCCKARPGCCPGSSYVNRVGEISVKFWVENQSFYIRILFNIPTNCINDNRPIPT